MTQQIKKSMKLKNKGFMLAEAVFAVFVTLLVVLMLQSLLKSITVANKAEHHTDDLVFSYVQFNRFLHDEKAKLVYVDTAKSNSGQAQIVKVDQNNEKTNYKLSLYNKMLRVTTAEGGHMPLLLRVINAQFIVSAQQVKIKVTESDNRQSELVFKLDKQPEKKMKHVQIKKAKGKS